MRSERTQPKTSLRTFNIIIMIMIIIIIIIIIIIEGRGGALGSFLHVHTLCSVLCIVPVFYIVSVYNFVKKKLKLK